MVLCRLHGGDGLDEPSLADGPFDMDTLPSPRWFDTIVSRSAFDNDRSWDGEDDARASARYFLRSFRANELSGIGFFLELWVFVAGISTSDFKRDGENLTRCPPFSLVPLDNGMLVVVSSAPPPSTLHVDRFLVLRIGKVLSATQACAGDLIAAMHARRKVELSIRLLRVPSIALLDGEMTGKATRWSS